MLIIRLHRNGGLWRPCCQRNSTCVPISSGDQSCNFWLFCIGLLEESVLKTLRTALISLFQIETQIGYARNNACLNFKHHIVEPSKWKSLEEVSHIRRFPGYGRFCWRSIIISDLEKSVSQCASCQCGCFFLRVCLCLFCAGACACAFWNLPLMEFPHLKAKDWNLVPQNLADSPRGLSKFDVSQEGPYWVYLISFLFLLRGYLIRGLSTRFYGKKFGLGLIDKWHCSDKFLL